VKRALARHRQGGISVNYTTRDERAGTHNRKARRAGKVKQQEMFAAADPEVERLRALWSAFGRHHERTRPEREARSKAFTVEQYDSENEPLPPEHLNLTLFLQRVEAQHALLRGVPFEDRQRKAFELAYLDYACLCDQDVVSVTKKGRAEDEKVVDGLAAALTIGALQPGGIKLWSMWFESIGGELKIRFLVDPNNPWLEVTECA
jgi:hypothetical protein